ncbi:MAG TPA: hypothetical protein VGF95_05775 [Solirubrobacteraceae bacterium]|jgi:predicted RNase H-like HicB family nuclease
MPRRVSTQLKVEIRSEDGSFWATVEQFPGVFATGDTLEELHESLLEGIGLYLAEPGKEPPKVTLGEIQLPAVVASPELVYA